MAGYSKTPLIQKLGIKPGARMILIGPPPSYNKTLGGLPKDIVSAKRVSGEFDFIQIFSKKLSDLKTRFPALKANLKPTGMIWISWPKKASGVPTDLDEHLVREIGLRSGLVDVKVCAIDETWSGLKFMVRLKDRVSK